MQNVNDIRRLRGTPLPDEWIKHRLDPYLPDDELTKAITSTLQAHHAAVLHAPAGTGRYTTALHVLTRLPVTDIRQVRREPGDIVDLEGLTDEDTGWILDLRDKEETLHTGFGLHLKETEEHLRAHRSFIVVVTHTDTWGRVADEATELGYLLNPPEGLKALRAHLTHPQPGIDELDKWLAEERIIQAMAGATPATAAHWARIIRTAVGFNSASTEPKPVSELIDPVIQSAHNWRRVLREWHTHNTNSVHRNYLLAAAALDGAPAEAVYDAHTSLGTALDDITPPPRGQQGPGIIELTHTVGAELGTDDRIRFLQPGYAEAVVDYFWVDRPHHAAAFTQWTAEQTTTLPADLGSPLAERVTQWATHYTLAKQNFSILRAITTHWAGSARMRVHAQELLVAAALDPSAGKGARDQYLAWAKNPDTTDLTQRGHTPTVLKRALAGALAELGSAYPQIALKRLAELAANTTHDAVTGAVGHALTTLWDQPSLQEKIRTTLTSWFTSSQDHYTKAARRAFLHLAERTNADAAPLLLAPDGHDIDPWVMEGWRCALDEPITPTLQNAFDIWMDAALVHPALQPTVLNAFTEAVFRSETDRTYLATRFLVLNHAANGWEPARAGQQPNERTRLRDTLVIALRDADPTTLAHAHHAPPQS